MELSGQNGERRSRVMHLQHGNGQADLSLLGDNRRRSTVDSLTDEGGPVVVQAFERDEHVPGRDLT
jgi:hypothetical protein